MFSNTFFSLFALSYAFIVFPRHLAPLVRAESIHVLTTWKGGCSSGGLSVLFIDMGSYPPIRSQDTDGDTKEDNDNHN